MASKALLQQPAAAVEDALPAAVCNVKMHLQRLSPQALQMRGNRGWTDDSCSRNTGLDRRGWGRAGLAIRMLILAVHTHHASEGGYLPCLHCNRSEQL